MLRGNYIFPMGIVHNSESLIDNSKMIFIVTDSCIQEGEMSTNEQS